MDEMNLWPAQRAVLNEIKAKHRPAIVSGQPSLSEVPLRGIVFGESFGAIVSIDALRRAVEDIARPTRAASAAMAELGIVLRKALRADYNRRMANRLHRPKPRRVNGRLRSRQSGA